MEQIDYVTIFFQKSKGEVWSAPESVPKSNSSTRAQGGGGGGVLLIYMCAIDSMHEIQLCLAVASKIVCNNG